MKKYIVVQCDTYMELERRVNIKIEDGYEPLGGLSVTNTSVHNRDLGFYQSMIKKDENKSN